MIGRCRLGIGSMVDSAHRTAHGNLHHGLGDVDALFAVAHDAAPGMSQPNVLSPIQRLSSTLKPTSVSIRRTASMRKSRKTALSSNCLRPEAPSAKRCLVHGQRLRIASRIICVPALSEMLDGPRLTASSRPPVSTAMWRQRLIVFFVAS